MEIEIDKPKGFRPIELKITIQSEKELCDLWHRVNISESQVDKASDDILKYGSSDAAELFDVLDYLVTDNGLHK